jgi:hypothetical protein
MKQIVYLFSYHWWFGRNPILTKQRNYSTIKVWTGTAYIRSTSKNESVEFKTIEYLGDIAGSNKKWDDAVFYYKS